ncbi:MAG: hypothetical protein L3K00_05030 [Thermoplasmata archaeon]|nr:hypothetical protein [Thermoplasmata archaeon]MCI4362452.1 hypothetical protein [Thermoplasmata archaeon]
MSSDVCVIPGCGAEAVRHLAVVEARRAFEQVPDQGRSAALCKIHYKEWKKATKKDRKLDRMGGSFSSGAKQGGPGRGGPPI